VEQKVNNTLKENPPDYLYEKLIISYVKGAANAAIQKRVFLSLSGVTPFFWKNAGRVSSIGVMI